MQKKLGMASQGWRMAHARYLCARSLSWDAQRRADIHLAAVADARGAMRDPLRKAQNEAPHEVESVVDDHRSIAKRLLAVAHAHKAVADQARAEAADYAAMLINEATPELVRERLSELEPAMAAIITRRFGANLADARTRARIFEACDYAQWEGAVDAIALKKHESI
jgi:hypothetical protein